MNERKMHQRGEVLGGKRTEEDGRGRKRMEEDERGWSDHDSVTERNVVVFLFIKYVKKMWYFR